MAFQTNAFQGNDDDLLARMRRFEDHFVERKTVADRKDWLKTIVAFANSTPTGRSAVLFIGVKNSGEIEEHENDLDTVQKTLDKELQKAYPPINCRVEIVHEDGRQALAVIVTPSDNKPHFSGPSFVRRGSLSVPATEQEFSELIARRNSKASRLLDIKGKPVTIMNSRYRGQYLSESTWPGHTTVFDCDQFYVTLATGSGPKDRTSISLEQVEILFDHEYNRPLIKLDR
jgi:predicted HTH transcriptional regulator